VDEEGEVKARFKNGSAYFASKGVIGSMKSVAWKLSEHQISVNYIEPGPADTPNTQLRALERSVEGRGEDPKNNKRQYPSTPRRSIP
jgi:NAD(P)-dependent dehydrogenase (short-subunit alcohol dehydrogenase family)